MRGSGVVKVMLQDPEDRIIHWMGSLSVGIAAQQVRDYRLYSILLLSCHVMSHRSLYI